MDNTTITLVSPTIGTYGFNGCSLLSFSLSLIHFTDFLNELLKSRKKKASAMKAEKNKTKINDFEISDDESKHGRMKRVSFLKTQRISSPSEDTTASQSHAGQHNDYDVQHSTNASEDNAPFRISDGESTEPEIPRESNTKSLSSQSLEDSLLDLPLPLPSDNNVMEPHGTEEKTNFVLEESSQTPQLSAAGLKYLSSAGLFTLYFMYRSQDVCSMIFTNCHYLDSAAEKEPPRPKPRQRTLGMRFQATEKMAEDAECQDLSRPQTSSVSIPLFSDTSINSAVSSSSIHMEKCLYSNYFKL